MRGFLTVAIAIALGACGDDLRSLPEPDGGTPVDGHRGPDAPAGFNFFGENCTEAPYPAVTFCHGDRGWCVSGVCRPQCSDRCPPDTMHYSDRGACYCAP